MNEKVAIHAHIFKIDNCMSVKSLAETVEYATAWVKRMWPRSVVEFVKTEFSHFVDEDAPADLMINKTKLPKTRTPMVINNFEDDDFVPTGQTSVEDRLAQKIGETYGTV